MKLLASTLLLTFASLLSSTLAHPSIFAPNHATIQKRCPPFDPAGNKNIGNGQALQFIGGQCLSNADCALGCCANPCGICSGIGAANQAGKTGCGFGGAGESAAGSATGNANNGVDAGNGTGNAPVGDNGSGTVGGNNNNGANENNNPNDDVGSPGSGSGNGSGSSCNSSS